jgi:hypothetical protein
MIRYDDDLAAWARQQAELIEHGDLSRLDREHVADEIRDVARACERELYDALVEFARLMSRGLSEDCSGVERCLRESPSLSGRMPRLIDEAVAHAYSLDEDRRLSAAQVSSLMHSHLERG